MNKKGEQIASAIASDNASDNASYNDGSLAVPFRTQSNKSPNEPEMRAVAEFAHIYAIISKNFEKKLARLQICLYKGVVKRR